MGIAGILYRLDADGDGAALRLKKLSRLKKLGKRLAWWTLFLTK
jgi:hypothetical protein